MLVCVEGNKFQIVLVFHFLNHIFMAGILIFVNSCRADWPSPHNLYSNSQLRKTERERNYPPGSFQLHPLALLLLTRNCSIIIVGNSSQIWTVRHTVELIKPGKLPGFFRKPGAIWSELENDKNVSMVTLICNRGHKEASLLRAFVLFSSIFPLWRLIPLKK